MRAEESLEPAKPEDSRWDGPQAIAAAIAARQRDHSHRAPLEVSEEFASVVRAPLARAPSRAAAWMELGLMASGVALVGFMTMHMGLLLSSVAGAAIMNRLAAFLERYYLLQSVAPLLILVIVAHVFLALRKLPNGARQQLALLRHTRSLRHLDTWMWLVQILTGFGLLVLASIHLWVILTDLPIEAAKSGARVRGVYLWFYAPFIILVEAHASAGLYRIAVKWGWTNRRRAHIALAVWTGLFLMLGFLILLTFYRIGGRP